MIHTAPSEHAGQRLALKPDAYEVGGHVILIEDWWDRVAGRSWMDSEGNPAALHYAYRAGYSHLPIDNQVLYGKIGGAGHLVHLSELELT